MGQQTGGEKKEKKEWEKMQEGEKRKERKKRVFDVAPSPFPEVLKPEQIGADVSDKHELRKIQKLLLRS